VPQDACSGCYKAVCDELAVLNSQYMKLLAEANEYARKADEAASAGEIVSLPRDRRTGTESAPIGFEAVHATTAMQVKGRYKPKKGRYAPAAGDELHLSVFHRTTRDGRGIVMERPQAEALHAWLGAWLEHGWPGVPRKCGRHYRPDPLHDWQCDQEPAHDGDHEGPAIGWSSKDPGKPGRATWPKNQDTP
jgi:hypothetical protein